MTSIDSPSSQMHARWLQFMTRYHFIFAFILFALASCKDSNEKVIQPKNDTTKVIELALRTAFYHQNLPEIDLLFYPSHFKDSILFTSDSLALVNLPSKVDSVFFKILTQNQICSIIIPIITFFERADIQIIGHFRHVAICSYN